MEEGAPRPFGDARANPVNNCSLEAGKMFKLSIKAMVSTVQKLCLFALTAASQSWGARGIDPGPPGTANEKPETIRHWAFIPPVRPALPQVDQHHRGLNPIDRFVLARLEKEKITPSPPADRVTLIRRLALDLTGLPPRIDEVDSFLNDDRPEAYGRLVDRLLASPHFGERWGRHWLDVARYADSNGYSVDAPRSIWKYRDWVIAAVNHGLPYDEFVIEQLAGDLLPNATVDQKVATGFHRNTQINEEGGIDKEQFRIESIVDRVATTGTAFLGLTVACAQCHDHKFDPITQREYYELFAFFNNADEPTLEIPAAGELAPGEKAKRGPTKTLVMEERAQPRETFIHIKGDFTRQGETVAPGVLKTLHPLAATAHPTRLELARWIVDRRNPLTARVVVNRIWQQYFGRGLVETENDFGTQGALPTHPEVLDWLATELMSQRWSLKAIHRLIVASAAYQQSSRVRPELAAVDPNNRWLARQSRLRLDAEIVRDVALAASGLLQSRIGGPSVFPSQPEGVMNLGQSSREWKVSPGADRNRRGLYTFFWRATPHPALMVFDAPDAFSACSRRPRANTPLQALTLLNDQGFFDCARALAGRVLRESPADDARIDYAFRLCLARRPALEEKQRLNQLLVQQLNAEDGPPREGTAGEAKAGQARPEPRETAAWTAVCRVLLNLDETITRE